jgi:hypothetical protein
MGFDLDVWDYITFLALLILVIVGIWALMFVLGLPGRIAIARHHPEAEAVNIMGWVGFMAVVPWIQAFIWAFKPTNVVDIRYMPDAVRRETDRQIAHLTGKSTLDSERKPSIDAEGKAPLAETR